MSSFVPLVSASIELVLGGGREVLDSVVVRGIVVVVVIGRVGVVVGAAVVVMVEALVVVLVVAIVVVTT